MRISTETYSIAKIVGEEKAIEYIAEAGFDAWDFSMFDMCAYDNAKDEISQTNHPLSSKNYLLFARRLKEIGLQYGIVCNQSHAPILSFSVSARPYLLRAIECTAEAGGSICVIHPDNNRSAQENAEFYHELLPFAKSCGVKIATENIWNWDKEKGHSCFAACATSESFLEHLSAVNDAAFTACLDIGHAQMKGSGSGAVQMIRALGPQLSALHIHDNDCINDLHQIPFSMSIDFKEIVRALKEINYQGDFTLEASCYLTEYTKENVFSGVKELADSAKKLTEMFDQIGMIN